MMLVVGAYFGSSCEFQLEQNGAALRLGRVRREDDVDLLRGQGGAHVHLALARLDHLVEDRLEGRQRRTLVT